MENTLFNQVFRNSEGEIVWEHPLIFIFTKAGKLGNQMGWVVSKT